jgi:signal transduction histidine kinase
MRTMNKRLADALSVTCALAAFGLFLAAAVPMRPSLYLILMALLAGAMLVVGAWWLSRRAPGSPFQELAIPASVATVLPLLVVSTEYAPAGLGIWLLACAVGGALAVRLGDWLDAASRPSVIGLGLLLAAGAAVLGMVRPGGGEWALLSIVALAAATAVTAVLVAAIRHTAARPASNRMAGVTALEIGVVCVTPAISVLTIAAYGASPWGLVPLVTWILVVLVVQYVAVGPLAQSATVATTQRDLVVAAMEAERSRIAADIHDDALQELTLLAWQLDSSGQGEGARAAREIAERLRAICGDLRLPILDDLGTGPALEWLVERVGRLAGGEVRLERGDQVRPPPDVELAFFRVAQEALSNAVRHGRPPIVVRYWTSPSGASLSIDDAGGGFDPVRIETGEGHFGLLNMRQRAEQVGALLDIRRWPKGGTQVALEWRAR